MPTITAIAPGGRYVAFASFVGESLQRTEVCSLRSCRTPEEKFATFVEKLRAVLDEDQPVVLVIEALRPIRSTTVSRAQAERAAREANERGLRLQLLDLRRARDALVGGGRTDVLAAQLAARFPETRSVLGNPQAEPRRVRQLTAAVALGLTAARLIGTAKTEPLPDVCKPSDPPANIQE